MRERDVVIVLVLLWLLWPAATEDNTVVLDYGDRWPRETY